MNKQIDLSPRLQMVAQLLPKGVRLADIGTDHGYLPCALILDGQIPSAIAADLRQGPLSRAKETVRACGLTNKVSFRLCDGLAGISPDEVDGVVIAGMGGETIAAILAAAPWTRDRDLPIVLQPMSSMPDLRRWLGEHGYEIRTEELTQEGRTLYTALAVGRGHMPDLTPEQLYAGKNANHPLRGVWLDDWLGKAHRALEGLSQANQPDAVGRRTQMEQVYSGLLAMKEEWESWQR